MKPQCLARQWGQRFFRNILRVIFCGQTLWPDFFLFFVTQYQTRTTNLPSWLHLASTTNLTKLYIHTDSFLLLIKHKTTAVVISGYILDSGVRRKFPRGGPKHRRSQGRAHATPQICRKYSHFVLWEAFF